MTRNLLAVLLAGCSLLLPITPFSSDAGRLVPAQPAVSPDSILATARVLSGETGLGVPSRVGRRPETDVYTNYLLGRLDDILRPLGGGAYLQAFDPGFDDQPPEATRDIYKNVVGFLPGRFPAQDSGLFMMGGHYDATSQLEGFADTTWNPMTADAPGADDNASGIAAILEALRVMAESGWHPEADLMIVFFDGEEQQAVWDPDEGFVLTTMSLLGSSYLADSLLLAGETIHGFVNMDMVAHNPRQDSLVVVTNPPSRWLADQILEVWESDFTPGDLLVTRLDKGLSFSDHGPFWARGYDAVLVLESTDLESHAGNHYHRVTDTVDNTYSRNGSQVVDAARVALGLLERWSWTESDSQAAPHLTEEDILVQDAISVDRPVVEVGEDLEVQVGITNRGGSVTGPAWRVDLLVESLKGELLENLGTVLHQDPVPAGGRVKVRFPWQPSESQKGSVKLTAILDDGVSPVRRVSRIQTVRSEPVALADVFVYPNPVRDLADATISYQLSAEGSVRIGIVDASGRQYSEVDIQYSGVNPNPGTEAGLARVPLRDVLQGQELPPGLFYVRVEAFRLEGGSAGVELGKFAVLR